MTNRAWCRGLRSVAGTMLVLLQANGARGDAEPTVDATPGSGTNAASTDPSRHRRADESFREGQRQLRDGNTSLACSLLAESLSLDAALGTLLNLALCHQTEGKLATALREFERAAQWAHGAGETARESYARERVAVLTRTAPRIRLVTAKQSAPLAAELDGNPIDVRELLAGYAVDVGRHVLVLARAGRIVSRSMLDVAPDAGTSTIVLGEPTSAPPAVPEATSNRREWAAIVTTAGTLAVTGGVYLLLRAKSLDEQSQAEAVEARASTPTDETKKRLSLEHYDSAVRHQNWGFVALGAGVAGLGTGIYLFVARDAVSKGHARLAPPRWGIEWQGPGITLHTRF